MQPDYNPEYRPLDCEIKIDYQIIEFANMFDCSCDIEIPDTEMSVIFQHHEQDATPIKELEDIDRVLYGSF